MGINFNFPANFSLRSRQFQLPAFDKSSVPAARYNPSFGTQSYSTRTETASLFDITSFISSLRERFSPKVLKTYGDSTPKSEPIIAKDTPLSLDEDFTVMQNYGIVCPKDTKESEIKEAKYYANYGIVCPPKEEPADKEDMTITKRETEFGVSQNYGIVCKPVEEDTSASTTKFRSDESRMYANYGIVCPGDF